MNLFYSFQAKYKNTILDKIEYEKLVHVIKRDKSKLIKVRYFKIMLRWYPNIKKNIILLIIKELISRTISGRCLKFNFDLYFINLNVRVMSKY